jgi:hypothetical protein
MPDLTILPLDQLLHYCAPLAQPLTPLAAAAWAELLRRALREQSDAAWDALVVGLWPAVLAWVYAQRPDLAPTAAELVAQRVIFQFRGESAVSGTLSSVTDAAALRTLLLSSILRHLF